MFKKRSLYLDSVPTNKEDIQFMNAAIALGKQAMGKTADNPYVGAVLVKHGKIIGQGFTHPPGQAHAEVAAIRDCEAHGFSAEGATVYTTVEPCSFQGRTPSCALLLVEKRVARVVVGIMDPHPNVNGRGFSILRSKGILVDVGICSQEVNEYLSEWLERYSESVNS